MARKLTLDKDPRWKKFVQRYAFDLTRFSIEVVGRNPTWQQLLLFDSVQNPGSRTSVRSGHGTGKTASIAIVTLWHLLCYYKSNTLITAPKIEQVRNLSWKEIVDSKDMMEQRGYGWMCDYFAVEAERVYVKGHKDTWWATAKTAPRGAPENLAGMHRDWLLIIADEASGIPDANYSVLGGALTDARNRMMLTSQPTRPAGFFYDTHHSLSTLVGGVWTSLCFNSEVSPLVSVKFIKEKLAEYGGVTSPEYQIRVKGEFPTESSKFLLSRPVAEACFGRKGVLKGARDFGYFITVDVAAGEYRDKSVVMVCKVSGFGLDGDDARRVEVIRIPVFSNTIQPNNLAGEIKVLADEYPGATILIDCGGYGLSVYQRLVNELNVGNCKKILWGNPCFSQKLKDRFFNLRAQSMYGMARAAKEGRLSICETPWKSEILGQMARIPYHFDEKARYTIYPKHSKEWENIGSPDGADALSFLFIEGAHYIPVDEESDTAGESQAQRAVAEAADAFSDAA